MNPAAPTVAERYLTRLRDAGIQYLYVNAGTDFAPIVEAYVRPGADRSRFPVPVLAAHENLAAGMAHGAFLATGRPQGVMFHVSVGTANAVCAVINAARENVPLIVTAGRTPILESGAVGSRNSPVHWAQEMFDQGGLLRELVKWDYELRLPAQVDDIVERAVALAAAEPAGPVYLSLPREVLAQPAAGNAVRARLARPAEPRPDPGAVELLADRLADARLPVVATSAAGTDRRVPALLAELCERFAIGLVEASPRYLNVPAGHRYHLGEEVSQADTILVLESDVPWIPSADSPGADAFVAHAGRDPLFARYPVRGHRSDLTLVTSAYALLGELATALEKRVDRIDQNRSGRLRDQAGRHAQKAWLRREAALRADGPITKDLISAMLGELLPPDAVVFNEYWAEPALLERRVPGTYFKLPSAGGLGWGLPAALGFKHAAPGQTVVATLGDGAYLFSNPAACHHAAQRHELGVLTVVANNARWNAVETATASVYPGLPRDGVFSDLTPAPALHHYVRASGGYGEHVSARGQLARALERGLESAADGRQALINIECA
jgi:acetolactate synthase I/II/III large subunit